MAERCDMALDPGPVFATNLGGGFSIQPSCGKRLMGDQSSGMAVDCDLSFV